MHGGNIKKILKYMAFVGAINNRDGNYLFLAFSDQWCSHQILNLYVCASWAYLIIRINVNRLGSDSAVTTLII